jgi:hypothetical protein
VHSSPAFNHDSTTIFVGSYDDNVYALDTVNGTQKWAFKTDDSLFSSSSLSQDGTTIFVGSVDDNVYAIDTVNGTKKWAFNTGNWVLSSTAISHDCTTIFVGSWDNNVYAIDTGIVLTVTTTTTTPTPTTTTTTPTQTMTTPTSTTTTTTPTLTTSATETSVIAKDTAYRVEIKLGFASELTQTEQTNVKKGIASAAKVFVENVDLKKDSRRSVTYTATVYIKDSSSAVNVQDLLGETALKNALVAAGAPTPTSVDAASIVAPSSAALSTASVPTRSVCTVTVMVFFSIGIIHTW